MSALTYVLIRSRDSIRMSLVNLRDCSRFTHSWLLLAATPLVESTAMISRRESNAEEKGTGQLSLSFNPLRGELGLKAAKWKAGGIKIDC